MATSHRIFTSFAREDARLRDFLVGQARNGRFPFSFVEDGVIGIITRNTAAAAGQLREPRCAYEEKVPVRLIYGSPGDRPANLPDPVRGRAICTWTWESIANFPARP